MNFSRRSFFASIVGLPSIAKALVRAPEPYVLRLAYPPKITLDQWGEIVTLTDVSMPVSK